MELHFHGKCPGRRIKLPSRSMAQCCSSFCRVFFIYHPVTMDCMSHHSNWSNQDQKLHVMNKPEVVFLVLYDNMHFYEITSRKVEKGVSDRHPLQFWPPKKRNSKKLKKKLILKSYLPLQSCCYPVQKDLLRKAELAWQVSLKGHVGFQNKKSRPQYVWTHTLEIVDCVCQSRYIVIVLGIYNFEHIVIKN